MIKALGAILTDIADENDFVGHIEADDFIMTTPPAEAARKAERICQQFDTISTRFYPKGDLERGYLISTGRGGIRRRIPLISIAIGIVDSTKRRFHSYVDVLTTARDARYLAKEKAESCYVVSQTESDTGRVEMTSSKILVVEPDGAMACLLQETLSLEGYIVDVTASADDALEMCKYDPHPDLVLLESNLTDRVMDGWKLCQKLKEDNELSKIWVVMATSHPDQSRALEAGADLYLPKPFDMPSLLTEISQLLKKSLA